MRSILGPGSTAVVFGEALVDDFGAEQIIGGAPFNVARNLAAFMAPQLMITRVGDDRNGTLVRAEFEHFAMSTAGLQVDAMEETGRVVVERAPGGHRFVILPNQAYDYIDTPAALHAISASAIGIVCFGTLAQRAERSRAALFAVLDATAAAGAIRYLDLNLRGKQVDERCVFHSMQAADIVKVNEEELQALFAWYFQIKPTDPPLTADETRASCRALLQMLDRKSTRLNSSHLTQSRMPSSA